MGGILPLAMTDGLGVVLFSGGRGSGALVELLATDRRVSLTVAINGYDDGASTGVIRRFLGDALGPSDFRKNASRCARLLGTCPTALIDLLDRRLPDDAARVDVGELAAVPPASRAEVRRRLEAFDEERRRTGRAIELAGASVGNVVFAGCFLQRGRCFNDAVDDYCALVGLPEGLIENVTDGQNAFLVAIDDDGAILTSEEQIVDAKRRNRVREIFLIAAPLSPIDVDRLLHASPDERRASLEELAVHPRLNPRLAARIAGARLIVYAPGTQHSSLFPSYLTKGLGEAIAANVGAVKLLVTNIEQDAEIAGRSAVDLIDRAVFYLRDKGRLGIPAPFFITHYLLNDPSHGAAEKPYVPLGRLESIEDPRLVRVGNYEAGSSGRHDATKVLGPFIEGLVDRDRTGQRVAVLLSETRSLHKVAQTLLEMARAGIAAGRNRVTAFHAAEGDLDEGLPARLGFDVRRLAGEDETARDAELRAALDAGRFDYLVLFESSGMYNGEDIVELTAPLASGRLDAVWGSRRLSVRDIQESYRLRYRDKALQGLVSRLGSHVLSLQFLLLYGRYVTDTLSGARAIRVADVQRVRCLLTHKHINQHLLSALLRRRAEILELPVQFFAISPELVRRTTVGDGLQALAIALGGRLRPSAPRESRNGRDVNPAGEPAANTARRSSRL